MSIADIFARHGEADFRNGEARVIARLLEGGPQVLATGGGAFMNADTRAAMQAKAVSVWLNADFDVLMRRISKRKSERPLLQTADPAETLRAPARRARADLCSGRPERAVARRVARCDRGGDHDGACGVSRSLLRRRTGKPDHDRCAAARNPRSSTSRSATAATTSSSAAADGVARRPHRRAAAGSQGGHRHRRECRAILSARHGDRAWRMPAWRRAASSCRQGEASKSFRGVRGSLRGHHRRARRTRRSCDCARRRRHRRPCRLRGLRGAPRPRLRAGADHAAGAGRFLGRRQDRDQFRRRQEPDRRFPSADPGGRRHATARHLAGARIPRRLRRSRQVRPARRRVVLPLAGDRSWRNIFEGGPAREFAIAAPAVAPRPRSSRATSARPASARCSISATPSATRSRRPADSPTGCCTARRSPPAWRSPSRFRRGAGCCRQPKPNARSVISPKSACRPRRETFPADCPGADALMELIAQDKKVKARNAYIHPGRAGSALHSSSPTSMQREVRAFLTEKLAGAMTIIDWLTVAAVVALPADIGVLSPAARRR